ncbi:hypothetical protein [Litoribrevibacter albus]|uniref:Uncharacterized protein n=1 Tax=Litoribrevibacter albus TaxID=1473156 RepID=A0AA37SB13_9GAMM|nr:hypothetical protein [Litoribrevibacter albus]GLQ31861.1 hypothetical protein GCM10007876_23400 [Litoribrevibacter albus]
MLDKESLQAHCEALLEQRLFLQQMKLTKLQQLRQHDDRVVDSLNLLKRYLPLEQASHYLTLVFSSVDEWSLNLSESDLKPNDEFTLYLAEISAYLGVNQPSEFVTHFLSSTGDKDKKLGFKLATRFLYTLSDHEIRAFECLENHDYLLHLGQAGQLNKVDELNTIIVSLQNDVTLKNVARLSRLFLGEEQDSLALLKSFIESDQITKQYLHFILANMQEHESRAAISLLANSPNVAPELTIYAMSVSCNPDYVPFLMEFLADKNSRDYVLNGLSTLFDDAIYDLIPYEAYHPTRDVAWSLICPQELESSITHWHHEMSSKWPNQIVAGQLPTKENLTEIWRSGNTFQRQQASLCMALKEPRSPLRSPISLFGGFTQ